MTHSSPPPPAPSHPKPTSHYPPPLPTSNSPNRVWFITAAASPIGSALSRELLAHGDIVLAGNDTITLGKEDTERAHELEMLREEAEERGWGERLRVLGVGLVSRSIIGALEELSMTPDTQTLIRDQFETKFFGPVNVIKAVLPSMRARGQGHVLVLSDITGHLGTPGLGMYCSAGWALEGFCDSLAYEVAPFNIRMTILQTNLETSLLTNKITFAPSLPAYTPAQNPAPLIRTMVGGLLCRLPSCPSDPPSSAHKSNNSKSTISPVSNPSEGRIESTFPRLPPSMKTALLSETIHAITAIGGHENPPARHIVGYEAVGSVKEKLKTVSEELEDFVEVSAGVDIDDGEEEARAGGP